MNLSSDPQTQLAQALVATAEALGQTLSASAAKLMAGDLIDEASTEEIALALRDCRRTLTGRLTVAAVVERLAGPDCFPRHGLSHWMQATRAEQCLSLTK